MDEQNLHEKIGIVKDLGDIKVKLAELTSEIKEMNRTVGNHHTTIFGDSGQVGIDKTVYLLNQIESNRSRHYMAIYTALTTLSVAEVWRIFIGK